ncbi:MAG: MBL fold metallo-hydrolase [Planctomycetota bacterium]
MRIVPLASGSLGNATLVESGRARLLIDAGLRVDELEMRLRGIGVEPRSIDALFVTHRHHDHIRGATHFAHRHRVRIHATPLTARSIGTEAHRRIKRIEPLQPFRCGDLELLAIPLEHDAPQTCALRVDDGHARYGHATDLGCDSGPIRDLLHGCDVLLLEFNHDLARLAEGGDPPLLKQRISSPKGHLDNRAAAALLAHLAGPRLQHVWLAHLSRRNNLPELALAAARDALHDRPGVEIAIALQDRPVDAVAC